MMLCSIRGPWMWWSSCSHGALPCLYMKDVYLLRPMGFSSSTATEPQAGMEVPWCLDQNLFLSTHSLHPNIYIFTSQNIHTEIQTDTDTYHLCFQVTYVTHKQRNKDRKIGLKKSGGGVGGVMALTISCDFIGGVEACISAGWRAHIQMEQNVFFQPVASLF